MKKRFLLLIPLTAIIGCGGANQASSDVPKNWDERYTYKPCEEIKTPNPQIRSIVGLLKALDENAWEVETTSQITYSVIAKACKLPLLVECERASFSVDVDGFITARPAYRKFDSDLREDMYSWLVNLDSKFQECRCADEEALKKKAFNYEIDFDVNDQSAAIDLSGDGGTPLPKGTNGP